MANIAAEPNGGSPRAATPISAAWSKVRSDSLSWRIELPERTTETVDIFEIMHTMRAMRRLKPDPVPDELIRKILLAGQAAANGGNTQRWRFLVLKNHPGKKVVQGYYKKLFDEVVGPRYRNTRLPFVREIVDRAGRAKSSATLNQIVPRVLASNYRHG
jgi:hypothetical protein